MPWKYPPAQKAETIREGFLFEGCLCFDRFELYFEAKIFFKLSDPPPSNFGELPARINAAIETLFQKCSQTFVCRAWIVK